MKSYFHRLYEYEKWANGRIISTLKTCKNPPERTLLLFGHLLIAQREWLNRIIKKETTNKFWELFSLQQCEKLYNQNNNDWSHFFLTIGENDLDVSFQYRNSKGEEFNTPMIDILTHLINHSSYHRGQIIDSLKGIVEPMPVTDFIVFSRNP